jgi:nucleoside-diphosphate-sugar epimerase
VAEAVRDQDVVIHLAFVIPKISITGVDTETQPERARTVNVGGTKNLLSALRRQSVCRRGRPARIIFASSIHVYGNTQGKYPLRTVHEQVTPEEHYARHKLECENLVRASGLEWCILRFAAALPYSIRMNPAMFDMPPQNRIEYIHTRDVGVAVANAAETPAVWRKTLLIGGGPKCQLYYRDMLEILLDSMGVGMLPESAFSRKAFATDWMDTRESQRLLHYQQRDLSDFAAELRKKLGLRRLAVRLLRPLVRRRLLALSPYYRPATAQERRWQGRNALVVNASHPIGTAAARLLVRAGMRVVLVDRDADILAGLASQLEELIPNRIRSGADRADQLIPTLLALDVTREDQREAAVRRIDEELGGVDVLINVDSLPTTDAPASWKEEETMVRDHLLPLVTLSHLLDGAAARSRHLVAVEEISDLPEGRTLALTRALRAFIRSFSGSLLRRNRTADFLATEVKVASPSMQKAIVSARPVEPTDVALRIWQTLGRPKRTVYLPAWFILLYWAEQTLHKALHPLIQSLRNRRLKPVV